MRVSRPGLDTDRYSARQEISVLFCSRFSHCSLWSLCISTDYFSNPSHILSDLCDERAPLGRHQGVIIVTVCFNRLSPEFQGEFKPIDSIASIDSSDSIDNINSIDRVV